MSDNDNLFALGRPFIMEQGEHTGEGNFEQRTSALLVQEYTTNEDPTAREYHQNLLWLGDRTNALIDCKACVRFNEKSAGVCGGVFLIGIRRLSRCKLLSHSTGDG